LILFIAWKKKSIFFPSKGYLISTQKTHITQCYFQKYEENIQEKIKQNTLDNNQNMINILLKKKKNEG
jgi:hypothetical protein